MHLIIVALPLFTQALRSASSSPQLSEKLRFYDPQLKEKPEQEQFVEPEWLLHLRQLEGKIRVRA